MADNSERIVSDPPAYRWISIVNLFFFLLSSVAVGDAIGKITAAPVQADFAGGVLFVYLAYWVIVAIHETGHAVCARLVGWRTPVIAVRGLTIWPRPLRFHYGFPAFGGLGGGVLAVPPGFVEKYRFVLVHLGGALGNFVLAALLIVCREFLHSHPFWSRYFAIVASLSALTGFMNLLPLRRAGGVLFDGSRVLEALRGANLQWFGHAARLSEEFVRGKRPREWSPDLVHALADEGESHGDWLLYCRAVDSRDLKSAREALDRQIAKDGLTLNSKIERAFLAAFADKDSQLAYKLLGQFKGNAIKRYPLYWRAKVAADAAAHDIQALDESVTRARRAWQRAPFATVGDFELLDELALTADRSAASTP